MRSILTIAIVSTLAMGSAAKADYEEPEYRVIEQREGYEIREYAPHLVAATTVEGDFDSTGGRAFRILARYIFGDNTASEKMEMTVPVTSKATAPPEETGVEMNMTVPVSKKPSDGTGDAYTYRFVMERAYTEKSLPKPNDPRVEIVEIPERVMAVRRYSGRTTERNFDENLAALERALARDGLTAIGVPEAAAYNGPFTLPARRRNEVMVEVKLKGSSSSAGTSDTGTP
ncbi:MAG: heme-binding protein [Acidobacteriota bacterium]